MNGVNAVLIVTMAMAAICVIASTWVSVGELHQIVDETARSVRQVKHASQVGNNNWRNIAERALEHIEHLPHIPHGVHIPQYDLSKSKGDALESAGVPGTGVAGTGVEPTRGSKLATAAGQCFIFPHTDYYGEAVKAGNTNKKRTAAECCEDCLNFKPRSADDSACNVWVWCGDEAACGSQYQHCWLKYLPWVYASKPKSGPEVFWTSGLLEEPAQATDIATKDAYGGADRSYHVVTSAQGSPSHWQIRIHYYWYKKQQKECRKVYGDNCQMGGFTRLLHSGTRDELFDEVPTFLADPLPSGNNGYVVLNRPYAFLQWTKAVTLKEKYVLMSEPDHVFLRPVQNPMRGDAPAAFPFFYIEPSRKDYVPITQKFVGADKTRKDCEKIAPIGSSPTFMVFDDLKLVAPTWVNLSLAIFHDHDANKEWGWVMEMYAFTIALFNHHIGPVSLHLELAAQPPWDTDMTMNGSPYAILHYTYGMDYTLDGVFTPGKIGPWRFDKRSYSQKPPPRHLEKPPAGMKNDLVRFLVDAINEGSDAIPGWDTYSQSGKAAQLMSYAD